MKKLIFALIVLASCQKQPIPTTCWVCERGQFNGIFYKDTTVYNNGEFPKNYYLNGCEIAMHCVKR